MYNAFKESLDCLKICKNLNLEILMITYLIEQIRYNRTFFKIFLKHSKFIKIIGSNI